jgi:N-acetylmuramoyl-L-alanine amidase
MRQGSSAAEHFSEKEWIPLSQWAKENAFKLTWIRRNELVVLTDGSWTLTFKTDSQLAAINGVNVWLCNPITSRIGQVCISSLDLSTSVEPILFPQTNHSGAGVQTICLDPGHGGTDTGGVSGSYMEKHYTLPLAEELAGLLEAKGFKVILTRTNDTFIELENRPALANRQKADLFISLHFNIGPPEAKGVEVYCLTPAGADSTNTGEWAHFEAWGNSVSPLPGNHCNDQNVLLAYELQKSLVGNLRANDRGVRRARFAVLRTATMPAVLIEGGFLSNSDDQKKIADPKYRSQIAEAVVQGVLNYKELFENQKQQAVQHLNVNE